SRASGVVAAYAQWHLERSLKSLPHVDRTEHPVPVPTTHGGPEATARAVATTPAPPPPTPDRSAPEGTRTR
ncbi:MAG: DNA repair protein RecO, partial [Curtobacterium sp.]